MTDRYPTEVLDISDDNGTMPASLNSLGKAVIGHRIVSAERADRLSAVMGGDYRWNDTGLILTLDDGTKVSVAETGDCCAYTAVEAFLLNPALVDHMIMGVGTTGEFTTWHIYADAGDVLKLTVGWSCGNPFYYGYGFDIDVLPVAQHG